MPTLRCILIAACCCLFFSAQAQELKEKTSFQIAAPWKPAYDVRSDIAIVYGMSPDFLERVQGYRAQGYNVQFMTGIAWGEYQDYFMGKFDGKTHWEDAQIQRRGDTIWHGHNVPYILPSANYLQYMKSIIKKVIDAGITTIYLEEPEFWARAGYGAAFDREWQKFYGFPWMAQHESPEATYLSSKLKYHLYFNALKEVFAYAKSYGESLGRTVKCFVPTHSLINYASWQIVSPEASLAALPGMDGYIAQVWTGTSREPVYYNGVKKERVFENAFLEYGTMLSMTAPTGRQMYFLTDPIEDARRSWDDYKRNYQATFTAEIMYPAVDHFEVMPWPNRIYLGKFKVEGMNEPQPIAPAYATQMQVMVNSLNDLPASKNRVNGSKGIGVLMGNSLMFQRFPTHASYEDPQLSNFYGMALPLLKKGVPVEMVHMENLSFPATLKDLKVLIMSYSNMKPQSQEVHKYLTEWVEKGGVLIYYGRDNDPFQQVKEWWNSDNLHYSAPSEDLFIQLRILPVEGTTRYTCGKGSVFIIRQDPKELVLEPGKDGEFVRLVSEAYEQDAKAGPLETKHYFYVERGPYDIAAVMDESISTQPLHLPGPVIDLFDPGLPVLAEKVVRPGEQAYLYNLNRVKDRKHPKVLCGAARVYEEERPSDHSYSFVARSPSGTQNAMRVLLPAEPTSVTIAGPGEQPEEIEIEWDEDTHTALVMFINRSEGVRVVMSW
ncbi:hypothetical protein [Chitinophaga agrisoli]|uniref:hypothetical protein n=1 Tax=Chitinophaga agrisoli TaxID=2607653 RepID=UPI001FE39A17|nr:hypothetical protein [Chitinophaga agrisoli]